MRQFKKILEQDMALERRILRRDRERLRKMPPGYLSGSNNFFYQCEEGGTRRYIPVRQKRLIRSLAMKGFLLRRMTVLQDNLAWQEKLLRHYQSYDNDSVLDHLSMACKQGLFWGETAAQAEKSEFFSTSMSAFLPSVVPSPASSASFASVNAPQYAADGTFRRSKSETIISNLLTQYSVSYIYEKPLFWFEFAEKAGPLSPGKVSLKEQMDLPDWILPDFTITLASGKVVYWEHLGMLKDPDYLEKFKKKLLFYHLLGINLGDRLIVTCDDYEGGLDSHRIAEIIEQLLESA